MSREATGQYSVPCARPIPVPESEQGAERGWMRVPPLPSPIPAEVEPLWHSECETLQLGTRKSQPVPPTHIPEVCLSWTRQTTVGTEG